MYLKRNKTPKTWPITRKGTKYVAVPRHNLKKGVPLLIILRDLLKVGSTRKEIKRILNKGLVKVNGCANKEERTSLTLYDTISLNSKENYRIIYSDNKKFSLERIKDSEINEKITKIINKKALKGNKLQVMFSDGRTLLINKGDKRISTGNSVRLNIKEKKIKKEIPLKENSSTIVIDGKHIGRTGKIKKMFRNKTALVKFPDKEIKLNLKNLMVI